MRHAALLALLVLAAVAAFAEPDPPGTEPLVIEVGKTAPLTDKAGANVLCDDLAIATPEYSPDGNALVLRALKPGTTLCGVWLGNQKPGGLYRVRVLAAAAVADAGPATADGGEPSAADAGSPPAGE